MKSNSLKILAIVPCPQCFGLQNLTLAFFGRMPPWVQSHFLNTRWTDGEFDRRLDALGIPHSSTWLGMFSRKLDRVNLGMTVECLVKLPIAWRDFLRIYRSFRPDIVYLANYHEVVLLWPLLLWVRHKVICHMHDPPPEIAFQKVSFFFWRRAVGRFVFISMDVQARTARLGSLRSTDTVIYNGVDVAPLHLPRQRSKRFCNMFGWPEESVIFGITGQLIPTKGHEEFLEAACLAHGSNKKTKFVIGGRVSNDEFTLQLQRLIADREMGDSIGFSGWLPRATEFYEGIDVLVVASRHDEGFGLVLAEAAERGVPAISVFSGGAVEVVVDGKTGMMVKKRDSQSLARAMTLLASDEALRGQMGQRARARVVQEFDLTVQSNRFVKLINQSVRSG
jgi:glycosyltransferase involved in cell wall biosynthesis